MPATTTPSSTAPAQDARTAWKRPEILAPAGDWECVRAAIENGADAVYFGLERFNARMRAKNFTVADLPALMATLHRRGVRGYVTFNTLAFADELPDAHDYLRAIVTAGVDAAIVQDVGICRLIRAISPDFPIHASTQMTVTSPAGVAFARSLGANLVVLARENSLREIAAIQEAQRTSEAPPLPLEVFVHGALCVAYSGQCLTSESLGGRSANRGECAQACRMPYELVSDGQTVPLGDRRYLLSPQDLSGLEVLPDLIRAGVSSLKIEGRLKSPEYVANITRVYRTALDIAMRQLADADAASARAYDSSARYDLEMAFSRGLHTGWFRGINNQELVHARFGTKRGVLVGTITHLGRESVTIRRNAPLKPGDGLVFDAGRPDEKEEGGRVYQVEDYGQETKLRFGRGDVDFGRLHVGDRVWKTNDPELDRRLRQSYTGEKIRHQRPVHFEVHGHANAPLTVIARDEDGYVARTDSLSPLITATAQPLTTAKLRDQLGRLGGTPFLLGQLENHLTDDVILPVSELNELRRRLVAELETQRKAPKRWTVRESAEAQALLAAPAAVRELQPNTTEPELIAVIRHLHQLEPAWQAGARTIYAEFEDPKKYREAVSRFRELRGDSQASLWVAPPRIFKPGEEWILKQVLSCEADGWLVRNYEHLTWFKGHRCRGDFSLNVANPLTAAHYIERAGLERVTASYDLNVAQLESLLAAAPGAWFDIPLHQHMPMFHMEHCVFCAFLSTGTDYRNCGRPCDQHDVRLRDRVGAEHPLKADAGCRNTVFNSRAQTGAEFVDRLLALGARSFRIEFLNESADEIAATLERYHKLLRGQISGAELWRELKLINQLGVTRGQLENGPRLLRKKS